MEEKMQSTSAAAGPIHTGPFAGIRVLDLSRVLAGPYASLVLADLGAEVIKVESIGGGDDSRHFRPPERGGVSTYFLAVNRNKKSVALDLKQAAGRDAFLELAARSDVVLENFRTGVVERLGIDYEAVKAVNAGVVYCSISGYGRDGSHATVPGYDPVAQAESGLMSMSGEPDGPPTRIAASHVDMVTGMFAAQAITAALWHRRNGGAGQRVEVCLFDTAMNMLLNYGADHLMAGAEPRRSGNGSPVAQPSGVFEAADGEIMITIASDRVFRSFCDDVLGRPELAADPDFATNPERVARGARLRRLIEGVLAGDTRERWLAKLRAAGVPSAPINSVREAFAQDLVRERALVTDAPHPTLGSVPSLASPMRLSGSPTLAPVAAPLLGQHTVEVLRDVAGLDDDRLAGLLDAGAAAQSPEVSGGPGIRG